MKAVEKLTRRSLALAVLVTSTIAASPAFADDQGPKGTVTALEINHSTSDTYLQHHGRVFVVTGTRSAEYRWGGVACGSRTLTENLVTMLQRALESGTPIAPRYKDGQGGTRCLVGFTLSP
jgi:hypothetical protein